MSMTIEQLRALVREVTEDVVAPLRERQTNTELAALIGAARQDPAQERARKGIGVARIVRALAAGRGDPERAAQWAKKTFGDEADLVVKALAASDATAGGVLVPPELSSEVIEFLRPLSAFRRLNPIIVPMDTGTLTMPKQTGGAQASYIGENQNIPVTQQRFGQVTLNWRKLAALVPISNDLLRFNTYGVDEIVRNDLAAALAQRSDLALIRNDGLNGTPKGLRNWVPADNMFNANSTVTLANVTNDLAEAILKLQEGHSRMIRPGWLLHPRPAMFLRTIRDGNGNFAFKDEMDRGVLFEFPFATTTQIPANLGAGSNESEITLADFADVVLGEATSLILDASSEAAYHDGSNVVAAFSLDQTVVRAILQHDLIVRHEESIAVITAVTWGS